MCVGFPGGSVVTNLPANAGDVSSIPGLGRSPGEGNGNPLQYSCLGNPMDRRAWWATVHGVTKSQIQLSNSTTTTVGINMCFPIGAHLRLSLPLSKMALVFIVT